MTHAIMENEDKHFINIKVHFELDQAMLDGNIALADRIMEQHSEDVLKYLFEGVAA